MGAPTEEAKPIFRILWDHKWLVATIVGFVVGLGVIYTMFSKPVWEASATIVFPSRTPSILGGGGMTDQSSLASALTGGPTPLKIYKGFLESERVLKMVSEATGMKRKDVFRARKIVDQSMESSLTVTARSTSAGEAVKVVQAHLEALNKVNTEVNEPLYEDDALVLGKKLGEQRIKVERIESQLLSFQQHAVTAPMVSATGSGKDSTVIAGPARWQELQKQIEIGIQKVNGNIQSVRKQVMASGKSGAIPSNLPPVKKWRDRLVELEYELKLKELTFAPESPEVFQLQETVKETRAKMEKEIAAYAGAIDSGAIDPTAGENSLAGLVTERFGLEAQLSAVKRLAALAPGESITLSQLTRELATQSAILQQVQAQYELAKIQEMRNPNRWQVLDEPEIDEDPVNKSYSKAGVMFGLLGMVLGAMAALIADSRTPKPNQVRSDSHPLREAA